MNLTRRPIPWIRTFAGIAILAASILFVLFSGSSPVTLKNIHARLEEFAASVSQPSPGQPQKGKFSYGDITTSGFGYSRTGEVDNLSLDISEQGPIDTPKWSISTDKMLVTSDPAVPGRLIFSFPNPINLIENSQLESIVTFPLPLKYSFMQENRKEGMTYIHMLHLPSQIIFTPGTTGKSPATQDRTILSFAENPLIEEKFNAGSSDRTGNMQFNNVKLQHDDGSELTVASLSIKYSEIETKAGQGQYVISAADISIRPNDKSVAKTYSLNADVSYSGDPPGISFKTMMPNLGNTSLSVNKLSLVGEDFKIISSGQITAALDDPLPFGTLDIHIENSAAFIASNLISDRAKAVLTTSIEKVTGQPLAADNSVTITLKREKNGVLYIGNMTFEAFTAAVAAELLNSSGAPPASVLSPSDNAPSPAPLH